jgi:cytochrome c oxidase subunit IV
MNETRSTVTKTLMAVWGALLTLTIVTILVSRMDLGIFNIVAVLSFATAKASLVALFFMDLRHESRLFRNLLVTAIAVLAIFLVLTFFDVAYRY